jgi:hypothetical protein
LEWVRATWAESHCSSSSESATMGWIENPALTPTTAPKQGRRAIQKWHDKQSPTFAICEQIPEAKQDRRSIQKWHDKHSPTFGICEQIPEAKQDRRAIQKWCDKHSPTFAICKLH